VLQLVRRGAAPRPYYWWALFKSARNAPFDGEFEPYRLVKWV
jgi:hypothetical protein